MLKVKSPEPVHMALVRVNRTNVQQTTQLSYCYQLATVVFHTAATPSLTIGPIERRKLTMFTPHRNGNLDAECFSTESRRCGGGDGRSGGGGGGGHGCALR